MHERQLDITELLVGVRALQLAEERSFEMVKHSGQMKAADVEQLKALEIEKSRLKCELLVQRDKTAWKPASDRSSS